MYRTSRLAAGVATTALVVAGVGVGLGPGVAAAEGSCAVSSHAEKQDVSTWGVTHVYDKIASAEQIGVGTSVTYKVIVGTTG
ncbi:hypothetical protein AB0H58_00005, partial [Nocardia neocaledoniensis]